MLNPIYSLEMYKSPKGQTNVLKINILSGLILKLMFANGNIEKS